jgi:hypothetical protein
MARTWLQVRVDLVGAGLEEGADPGRIFMVGPAHTFGEFADAINEAFARWDLAPLHEFQLADGRRIGYPDGEAPDTLDQAGINVAEGAGPGDEFGFVFDFGDDWVHRCRVLPDKLDPREELGPGQLPRRPVAILGWGWIPDQHGRSSAADIELDE